MVCYCLLQYYCCYYYHYHYYYYYYYFYHYYYYCNSSSSSSSRKRSRRSFCFIFNIFCAFCVPWHLEKSWRLHMWRIAQSLQGSTTGPLVFTEKVSQPWGVWSQEGLGSRTFGFIAFVWCFQGRTEKASASENLDAARQPLWERLCGGSYKWKVCIIMIIMIIAWTCKAGDGGVKSPVSQGDY